MRRRADAACQPPPAAASAQAAALNEQTRCYWKDNGCGYACFDALFVKQAKGNNVSTPLGAKGSPSHRRLSQRLPSQR